MKLPPKPKYELSIYRQFIRDAASYVSIILGRRVSPAEAETISDQDLTDLALKIDARVDDLKLSSPGSGPSRKGSH